jgi:hypothetical protein
MPRFDCHLCFKASLAPSVERRRCNVQPVSFDVLCPLRRAQWNVAVVSELAGPHEMVLEAVRTSTNSIVDFRWLSITPGACHALGFTHDDALRSSLLRLIEEQATGQTLFAAYQRTFLTGMQLTTEVCGARGPCMHQATKTIAGVRVLVTDLSAVDCLLTGQRLVYALERSIPEQERTRCRCLRRPARSSSLPTEWLSGV